MYLATKYRDPLRELLNIGAGRAAAELNSMLECAIQLRVPALEIINVQELNERPLPVDNESMTTVQLPFSGTFCGEAVLGFPASSATNLVELLLGGDSEEHRTQREATLTEIGNILLNSVMGTIANVLSGEFEYEVPCFREGVGNPVLRTAPGEGATILVTNTRFTAAGHSIEGDIHIVFAIGGFERLMTAIDTVDAEHSTAEKVSALA